MIPLLVVRVCGAVAQPLVIERLLLFSSRKAVELSGQEMIAKLFERVMLSSGAPGVCTAARFPKTAVDGKTSVAHRTGVGLADRSTDRINSTRARAPATGDGEPINRESLRWPRNRKQDSGKEKEKFHVAFSILMPIDSEQSSRVRANVLPT